MKKYLLPTLTVLGVALGILVGATLTQKANAQRIVYQNGGREITERLHNNAVNQHFVHIAYTFVYQVGFQ